MFFPPAKVEQQCSWCDTIRRNFFILYYYIMKAVEVETYDPKMFQAIMTIVIKNEHGEYAVLLKDLCESINVDVKAVNKMLELNYIALRSDNIPHFELSLIDHGSDWKYIQNGEQRKLTEDDKYIITLENADALPFALLDIQRDSSINTDFEERFAVILGATVKDCLMNASKFEK